MLDIPSNDILRLANDVEHFWGKGALAPIYYDKYLAKSNKHASTEPREIRIPKPLNELLKGDFEPRYTFTFTPPDDINGAQYWGEDSTKGVYVDTGYENGDSRFPSDIQLSDKIVHGLLGGMTGMGKSVLIESILYGILTRYPPWEVTLTLLDSKIVTFKPLSKLGIPHIQNIAATSDNDYLLSVLEQKVEEMNMMNQAFEASMTGAEKLEDLRERTRLCFPRNIIIFDEFQACLSRAGPKKESRIRNMLDRFGRLGRNTGYHLLLSSQEIGGALPPGLLNQIKLRMRLGCNPKVSDAILGNTEARNIKVKGKMYLNTEPFEEHNESYNREFRVPYLESTKIKPKVINNIKELASQYEYHNDLNFYNETDVIRERNFRAFLKSFERDPSVIYLGEPCKYTTEKVKITKIRLEDRSLDNIIILSPIALARDRYIRMVSENLKMSNDLDHWVFYNEDRTLRTSGLEPLARKVFKYRDVSEEHYNSVLENIFFRELLCDVDEKTFTTNMTTQESDDLYKDIIATSPNLAGETNRARCFYLNKLLRGDSYRAAFGYKTAGARQVDEQVLNCAWTALTYATTVYNCKDTKIVRENLPKRYIWLLDLEKVSGIGRDVNSKKQDFLKKACQDGPLYGVHLILVTSTVSDMTFLRECSTHVLMEQPRSKDINFIGASDTYPSEVSGVLGIYLNRDDDECYKFKKMFFNDEILVN